MLLLEAFAHQEGFYIPGSRPQRNNNPLDLIYCVESVYFGATASDGRFAIFPDALTGWKAGQRWLSVPARFDPSGDLVGGYLGATLEQVVNRFAPPVENNSTAYLNYVAAQTGLTADTVLTENLLLLPDGVTVTA